MTKRLKTHICEGVGVRTLIMIHNSLTNSSFFPVDG